MNHLRKRTILASAGLVVIGIAVTMLLPVGRQDGAPLPPPPGLVLLISSTGPEGRVYDYYRLSPDDPKPILIDTHAPGYMGLWQAASPDGQWLMFTKTVNDVRPVRIYRIRFSGKNQQLIAYGDTPFAFDWSPDGEWIVYTAKDGIYRVHPDGTGAQQLFGESHDYRSLVYSPDSQWIAFTEGITSPGGNTLYRMASDGSDVRVLAHGAGAPDWSPDGEWLVFDGLQSNEIYRIHPDGSGLEMLSEGYHPAWSPDGSQIAFFSCEAHPFWSTCYLRLMAPDGSDARELYAYDIDRDASDYDERWYPAWSPDGRWIAYIEYWELMLAPVPGDAVQKLRGSVITFSWLPTICENDCAERWRAGRIAPTIDYYMTPTYTPSGPTITPAPTQLPGCEIDPACGRYY